MSQSAEQALRESEERLRWATDAGSIGVAVWDVAADRVVGNEWTAKIIGVDPDAVAAGVPIQALVAQIHREDRARVTREVDRAVVSGSEFENEFRIVRSDGVRWIQSRSRVVCNAAAEPIRVAIAIVDITEHKHVEEELRESEARQRVLVALGDAIRVLTDAREIVAAASRLLGEHLGLDRVIYFEVDASRNRAIVRRDWTRAGVKSLAGSHSLAGMGRAVAERMATGQAIAIADLRTDPLTAGVLDEQVDFRAVISWPLIKHGQFAVGLAAHTIAPRAWRASEVALIGEVAERTWEAVERALAVDARRASDERYRVLFDAIDEGFCALEVIDDAAGQPHDYRFLEANPAFGPMTGLAESVGRTLRELAPDLDPAWFEMLAAAARTGTPGRLERRTRGGRRSLDADATRMNDAAPFRLAIVVHDVTNRRRAEGLLAAEKAVLEQIAAARPLADTLDRLTREVEALSCDGMLCSVLLADESGEHLVHGAAPSLPEAYSRAIDGVRIGPGVGSCGTAAFERRPVFVRDVSNDPLWCNFKALAAEHRLGACGSTPILSSQGRLLGTIAMYYRAPRDFSAHDRLLIEHATQIAAIAIERSRAEHALHQEIADRKRVEEALRQADRRKDEFLATLAHELRNPLAPISSALSVLKLAPSTPGTLDRTRETIEREVGQLVRLIDDLLDANRINRGTLDLRRSHVSLTSVLDDAVEAIRPIWEGAGHEVSVTLPRQPVYVHADALRLGQVFGNLLQNACKFTDRGGRIALSVDPRDAEVIVSVKDDGIGIPRESLDEIFEMFAQVDKTLERSQSGLGIGLTLVKRLVELHGGSVTAHSAGLGAGSEFVVRLPLAAAPAAYAPARVPEPMPAGEPLRILVVDDNQAAANVMAEVLALTGHEVFTANDGQAAVEAAARCRPDVVLLDIGMPRLNGYEACRQIRAGPGGDAVTIIAVTGWGQSEHRCQSRAAGFDGHLVKPVAHEALVELLASLEKVPGTFSPDEQRGEAERSTD